MPKRSKTKKSEDSEVLCPFCIHFVQVGKKERCDVLSTSERNKLLKKKSFECFDYINLDDG